MWHTWGSPNLLRSLNERLDEHCDGSGTRSGVDHAGQLAVARRSGDDAEARLRGDAGAGYLVCGWPEADLAQIEAFARDVMPEFA